MNLSNERKLAARAKTLGESADATVFEELAGLTRSGSPLVRRLSASALGKLSGVVFASGSVDVLMSMLADEHPQVRQYAAKALGAYGAHAEKALPDLRNLWRNPVEKDYVKRSVEAAGKTIREASRLALEKDAPACRRCSRKVSPDEYARSRRFFQRVFCDRCFDAAYLDRRNMDTKIESYKTIRARDGTLVQSEGERSIAEWLSKRKISYRYDERIHIIQGFAIRPDFYLSEFDLYIEYWGMDTADYMAGMYMKQKLYHETGKKLISIYRKDYPRIADILQEKLARYFRVPPAG